jgi:hypothetical protein
MKKKHENEIHALEDALEKEPKEPFKQSSELTNLRATEKQLAKLKKFIIFFFVTVLRFQEAQRAKLAGDQLV